ncbi:Predicted kinase, aminoglycoside phosphotransferase (APT) family [Agrococcus baldri]|uniref:Predicted kinase, aminoglycoside phosphotransferase (APT) family n=1 Tax=Agrococcus baldri TaxID=153730 RepID=A0AA94HNF2_9MICO|nr:phosphotransferase [Agrococcus baldri]SFS15484.1 Predicted kinase, aminoglycoside phosphotransferase (APT) family [Agrococcus baldri]
MSTNPFTLAALATTAVGGLEVVGATEDGSDEHRSLVAARLADGETVQVVLPRSVSALRSAKEHASALSALTLATRSRLPFEVPSVLGTTEAGKSTLFVLTRLGGSTMRLSDISPAKPGLAVSVGQAIAAIHELPTSVAADAGLASESAASLRARLLETFDRAAATGSVPTALLHRWETALGDDRLWQFKPTLVHGDLQAPAFRVEGSRVVGLDGWHGLSIGDPARDLAFLLGSSEFGSVDEAFEAHAAARGIGDRQVRQRAMLHAELDIARWLLHGVERDDASIIEDAKGMLAGLVARVDSDQGAAIAPERLETMDLTGVQEYLGEAAASAPGEQPTEVIENPMARDADASGEDETGRIGGASAER